MAYLADTSAWIKSRQRSAPRWLRERFNRLILSKEIVICDMVMLELLHNEDKPERFEQRRLDLRALPWCPLGEPEWERALEVQRILVTQGGGAHRVANADYLIAAAAEAAGHTVLHYDRDYDTIESATGQPAEWIAPRGSL